MKRGRKITLWIVLGIWVAAMLALAPRFISLHHETQSVESVFEDYRLALVHRDFQQAYQLCGDDFRSATSYSRFAAANSSLEERYGPLKSINETAHDVDGKGTPMLWRAFIDADFVYEKKSLHFRLVLNKKGERWQIYGSERL